MGWSLRRAAPMLACWWGRFPIATVKRWHPIRTLWLVSRMPTTEFIYRPRGNTWFVLSGEGDGKIFYEKVMFSCGGRLINSFALIYPAAQRQIFDPIVERVEDTFRAGTTGCQQGAALPPEKRLARKKAAPRLAAPRLSEGRTTRRAPRAAFADRIARSRGTDVLVVLRRASPPYDYKVVRGYASR